MRLDSGNIASHADGHASSGLTHSTLPCHLLSGPLIGKTEARKHLESECDFFLVFKPPLRIRLCVLGCETHAHYIGPDPRYLDQGWNVLFCNRF